MHFSRKDMFYEKQLFSKTPISEKSAAILHFCKTP